jgi:hypothetical protein
MEITFFGYIFLIICCFSLLFPIKYLFAVVVISCIFQSTAVINFADKGFPPYIIGEIFMLLRCLPSLPLILLNMQKERFVRYIVIFILFSVCASFILPHYWEGVMVYSESGIDSMVLIGGNPLRFGSGHIIQISYAVLNFLTVYCIYKNRTKLPDNFIKKIFVVSIVVVLLTGFWEFTAKTTGFYFPYTFFFNNNGYSQLYMQNAGGLMRLNSTFLEPSYCGAFLSASFWAMMSVNKIKNKLLCIIIGIALILNLSGTGIIAFLAGILIYICINKKKYILPLLISGLVLTLIINAFEYFDNIKNMLIDKMSSQSGIVRSIAAYFTWELFLQTKGTGIGLGSHRGSSFILNILACLGIIGTILFSKFYLYLLKHSRIQNTWLFSFTLVLLVAQCIAIPDFSFSIMWMCFFMSAALIPVTEKIVNQKNIQNN